MKILKFYAPWCAPCKVIGPKVEQIGISNSIEVVSYDVDENFDIAMEYRVRSVPTIILLSDEGKELFRDGKIGNIQAVIDSN